MGIRNGKKPLWGLQGLIITKPTHYGMQVSLNPRQDEKIIAIMKEYFPDV